MAWGPGKYDPVVTRLMKELKAKGIILVVIDGCRGSGFAMQAPIAETLATPEILRKLADDIEAKGPGGVL